MALQQRYCEWEDAVGILSVSETDLDFMVTHLLGCRPRANNAENSTGEMLPSIAQIFFLVTNFSSMFIEAFLLPKIHFFYASVIIRLLEFN